ncbi:MAG: aldolase catalytic domain-containing protein [Wenzhouxiangella sp.]
MARFLDCTLRDGGYYNAWDFPPPLINDYLQAVKMAGVDTVELGFRFLENKGFKGACAFTSEEFLESLAIPEGLTVGVMVNAADLCGDVDLATALMRLFPRSADESAVDLVRIACHYGELPRAFKAADWLAASGYRVGLNLMQISDRSDAEIVAFADQATGSPLEVLYVADSLGSLVPDDVAEIVHRLRQRWTGDLGVHCHDNLGLALSNTLRALAEGVEWLDATVTGMGRGPGNARTEELAIELAAQHEQQANLVPLMTLIRQQFLPMKAQFGWGTNPYYYLAGKHGIHPSYVQQMLADARYDDEDILAVIDHLKGSGGKQFCVDTLNLARNFYLGDPRGRWEPADLMTGREVLILGSGPSIKAHCAALEAYIRRARPLVMAVNTGEAIASELVDLRVACHPVRMLADVQTHNKQPQPLITPAAMLPEELSTELAGKELLDFGLGVTPDNFAFHEAHCLVPSPLVMAYALAVAASGRASKILMAGFDGYPPGDSRNDEIDAILTLFAETSTGAKPVMVTPTRHKCATLSVYGLIGDIGQGRVQADNQLRSEQGQG